MRAPGFNHTGKVLKKPNISRRQKVVESSEDEVSESEESDDSDGRSENSEESDSESVSGSDSQNEGSIISDRDSSELEEDEGMKHIYAGTPARSGRLSASSASSNTMSDPAGGYGSRYVRRGTYSPALCSLSGLARPFMSAGGFSTFKACFS